LFYGIAFPRSHYFIRASSFRRIFGAELAFFVFSFVAISRPIS